MAKQEVLANSLNQILENVLHFADSKSVLLKEVLFVTGRNELLIYASDGYACISDAISIPEVPDLEFSMSVDKTKEFLAWVKEDKKTVHKTPLTLEFKKTLFVVEANDFEKTVHFEYEKPIWDKWNILLGLMDEENEEVAHGSFNVNPKRLARLDQLKADKEAPICFRWVVISDRYVLQFKKGKTIIGAFQPVDDKYIQEEFRWKKSLGSTEVSPNSISTLSAENSTV